MEKKRMRAPSKSELRILRFMIFVGVFSLVQFFYYFLRPEYRGATFLYILLCSVLFYGAVRNLYLWYHYFSISVPIKPEKFKKLTVDILTTYFPGEPYEMICGTLEAIQKITYRVTCGINQEPRDVPYRSRKSPNRVTYVHINQTFRKSRDLMLRLAKAHRSFSL